MTKFWMHGSFGAAIAGGVWTILWQIFVTVLMIISTGKGVPLQLGPAVMAGSNNGNPIRNMAIFPTFISFYFGADAIYSF